MGSLGSCVTSQHRHPILLKNSNILGHTGTPYLARPGTKALQRARDGRHLETHIMKNACISRTTRKKGHNKRRMCDISRRTLWGTPASPEQPEQGQSRRRVCDIPRCKGNAYFTTPKQSLTTGTTCAACRGALEKPTHPHQKTMLTTGVICATS